MFGTVHVFCVCSGQNALAEGFLRNGGECSAIESCSAPCLCLVSLCVFVWRTLARATSPDRLPFWRIVLCLQTDASQVQVEMTEVGAKSGLDPPTRVLNMDEARRVGTLAPSYNDDRIFRSEWRTKVKSKDKDTEDYIARMNWTVDEARGIIIREKGWLQVRRLTLWPRGCFWLLRIRVALLVCNWCAAGGGTGSWRLWRSMSNHMPAQLAAALPHLLRFSLRYWRTRRRLRVVVLRMIDMFVSCCLPTPSPDRAAAGWVQGVLLQQQRRGLGHHAFPFRPPLRVLRCVVRALVSRCLN